MVIFEVIFIFVIGIIGFFLSRERARSIEKNGTRMHSRFHYYGCWTLFLSTVPSFVFLIFWNIGSNIYIEKWASIKINFLSPVAEKTQKSIDNISRDIIRDFAHSLSVSNYNLSINSKKNLQFFDKILQKKGMLLSKDDRYQLIPIALEWYSKEKKIETIGASIAFFISFFCCILGFFETNPRKRTRNKIEKIIIFILVISAIIAILTTIGIILSLLFQTINFFQSIPLSNFFLGTFWDPRFSSVSSNSEIVGQFGLLPLLFGTVYIASVAMFFAIPIGLFSAVYMAEYATPKIRRIIKPLLEILAGIPTIVYGFFSVIVVGPLLRDLSIFITGKKPFIMTQSILTAGFVMSIMLIPFISSLSDDIITAVPKSLRDGSLALGATRSETINRVVFPAAWPGIVSALLLTTSRAIGETMIVVLAAGVSSKFTLNPFDTLTTITVKIVNQLTGDLEFDSPQTLVAFALGITLFILTLLMNIFAVYIIRKYQENYE